MAKGQVRHVGHGGGAAGGVNLELCDSYRKISLPELPMEHAC